ncbi:MerR family transcriptional regulator [Ornithinibacillus californiensis]|uniref:MerR family transcriptional regulator n=1 Tax=Ornithinibacillus californiensis TaxID=161536 RepID=UPI00064DDBAF|nr:MerR family transcriptional regulator [Ornithinibacillus californiensis]
MYSIGKLAELSNVTVRTLRYYDEIGLLSPTALSDGGHRYYESSEIEKLQNILFLKEMGFNLNEIQKILANHIKSSKELLQLRLEILNDEQLRLKQQEQKIKAILDIMEMEGTTDWQAIFESTNFIKNNNSNKLKHYFTKDELYILDQLPKFGSDDVIAQKWVELIKDIKANINVEASSQIAQDLAKRWLNLVYIMYKGDWKLAQKVWNIKWEKNEDMGAYKFEPEIIDFMRKAQSYYFQENMDSIKQVIPIE